MTDEAIWSEKQLDEQSERAAGSSPVDCRPVLQFICVFDNGETFVTWADTKPDASMECHEKTGKAPWHILATGKRMANRGIYLKAEANK
jgi:hypothetical protein